MAGAIECNIRPSDRDPRRLSQSGPRIAGGTITLGRGTVLAAVRRTAGLLCLDLPEDEALAALLAAAYGRPFEAVDHEIGLIKSAAHSLRLGRVRTAEDTLESTRLGKAAEDGTLRLERADALLKSRESLGAISPSRGTLSKGNPNHLPCGPGGGQFCSAGAAGGISAEDGEKIVTQASQWNGTPYAANPPYAGDGAKNRVAADCSGSVHAIFRDAGFDYHYTRSVNFEAAADNGLIPYKEVTADELQPGDVVLYPRHMTVYAGNGQVWSAHRPGDRPFELVAMSIFKGDQKFFRYQSRPKQS